MLTDRAVRAAKPGARPFKLYDEGGLFLLVQQTGGKLWRLKFRWHGREQKLSLGKYPDTGLREAREARDAARRQLAAGINPADAKRQAKQAAATNGAATFKVLAEEYVAKVRREGRADATLAKAEWLLDILSPIGHRPVASVTPAELLAVLKKIEATGRFETTRRVRSFAGRVFRYAIATARAEHDPAAALKGALVAPRVKHHAAITEPAKVGELLCAIDGFAGQPSTQLALRLAPHVFVRPGELRRAEWREIDLEAAVWKIPPGRTKMRQEHVVPLSTQAVAILREAQALTGRGRYVFPSVRTSVRPISENTLNAALRRLGFTQDEMTAHGFRAMASTLLNESGLWSPDAIERALAHKDGNEVRAAYHRGAHWLERVRMAQWWSDHLDELRAGVQNDGRPRKSLDLA